MIPNIIQIRRDQHSHTHYTGSYAGDRLFVGFNFFAEPHQQRPISVMHVFNTDGSHVKTWTWEGDRMVDVEKSLDRFLNGVPGVRFHDVAVQLFSVKRDGLTFGLIADSRQARVTYEPYGLLFLPPWNGSYDT